jgi:hypothetical protein
MLLNFKKQFVPAILSGHKQHTIRAVRAAAPKAGEVCHCYTGLRQKGARLLGRWPCVKVEPIEIDFLPPIFLGNAGPVIRINGEALSLDECESLAKRDGFASLAEMMAFWEGRLPFSGTIIYWRFC